ncbi:MAG TPA: cytochrome c oxidase subunit I [Bryobacteraceae bacterium]|jgi:cytochrome c oxidase subunit 1/cytochrome c oxidase subunit I+III
MSGIPTTPPVLESGAPVERSARLDWVSTVDHKRIGILYLLATLVFFCIGGIEALLIRVQLAWPGNTLLSPDMYDQVFTMHGTTMVFLVVVPLLLGLANYMTPLMIGASDMALPRLNAFSFWTFLFGGILLHFSFIAGHAPDAGWFSYTPLSGKGFSTRNGLDYWALALLGIGVGTIGTAINLIATIFNLRTEGLTIRRLPLFVWMVLVNSFLIIFALPALNASLVMLLVDRLLNAHFFTQIGGGSPVLWQHYFWAFGHPEVYIMVLPAFGIISEVIPVFSRKPIFGYPFVAASTVAIGLLSLGVWAHHMFVVGLGHAWEYAFGASSLLIAVPTGVKIFNWIATMWGGAIRLTTSMLFAIAFLFTFTIGGLTGVTFATVPIDWQVTDTYYVVAHMHYVLFGGTLFAVMAGLYYWFPKMSGRMLSESMGKLHFWLMFIGFHMTFFIQHILGLDGMPRRVYTYPALPGWTAMNMISTMGAFVIGISILVLLANIAASLRAGPHAGPNPWNAWTLEWATSSPPAEHNFETVPPVHGRRPLWDLAHGSDSARSEPVSRVDTMKLTIAVFVLSEAVFFAFLIAAYMYYYGATVTGPTARNSLDPGRTLIFTICLLASSGTMWLAERRLARARHKSFRLWLGATILLGAVFIFGQSLEYAELIAKSVTPARNLFAATFFTLTGFHGLHVLCGLIALASLLFLAFGRSFGQKQISGLGAISIYWHFVDAVWIVIFSLVYLKVWL